MKETCFSTSEESSGLVHAFLELGESASGSDEEFLDFQVRIADANRERDASERMADWRASFATLQVKQAHEVAEFALARRREDEGRIDCQAQEINQLRRALEVAKLQTEQSKTKCAIVVQEKLKVEEESAYHRRMCDIYRESVNEHCQAQERMSREYMEMKRALEDALVTTCRLKVALEEKAAELVAWLGQEGVGPQVTVTTESLPSKEYIKGGDTGHAVVDRSRYCQQLDSLHAKEGLFEEATADGTCHVEGSFLATPATDMIFAFEEQFEDLKHEVLPDARNYIERRAAGQIASVNLNDEGEGQALYFLNSKGKEVVMSLKRKINELQIELERLQSLESYLENHPKPNEVVESWDSGPSLFQPSFFNGVNDHQEKNGLSCTTKDCEVIEICGPALATSSSDWTCTDDDVPENCTSRRTSLRGVDNGNANLNIAELEVGESFVECPQATFKSRADLGDKFICVGKNESWSKETIAILIKSITEELTKLVRVVARNPNASNRVSFLDLETQVKSWNSVTTKALQTKVSKRGVLEEWNSLVVDVLGQSREELKMVQQRLCDCKSELDVMDRLQAKCLASRQNISMLKDEIQRLEAQSFNDNIEREEEVNLLKEELEKANQIIAESRSKTTEEQMAVLALQEQLQDSEIELESAKLGWAAEQEFINSCISGGKQETEDRALSKEEISRMEKKIEDLIFRLEENDRELGELLIICGVDTNSVLLAKIRRLERDLEDAKASDVIMVSEKSELASQVTYMKARLAELDTQQIEMTEQGDLKASTRSKAGFVEAKLLQQVEQQLTPKTNELEMVKRGEDGLSASQTQLRTLRPRVLSLENSIGIARQNAVDCEAAIRMQTNDEVQKLASLELKSTSLQSNLIALKKELSETEQREKLAQSEIEKLRIELAIAKEEVFRYEVRLQKIIKQAKEDVALEVRKHENTIISQKQMEWLLCRQLEVTGALDRDKAKLHEVLEEFEFQNVALVKECEKLRTAYIQLAKRADQRSG